MDFAWSSVNGVRGPGPPKGARGSVDVSIHVDSKGDLLTRWGRPAHPRAGCEAGSYGTRWGEAYTQGRDRARAPESRTCPSGEPTGMISAFEN